MTMGERIKVARKKAGLTQEKLAKKCGIATITIGQYERNKREPNIETIFNLAEKLNVSASYLLGVVDLDGSISQDSFADPTDYEFIKALGLDKPQDQESITDAKRIAEEMIETGGYYRRTYLDVFNRLNDDGKKKAIERVEELAEIPKYTKRFDALTPEEKKLAESGQWGKLWQLQFGEDAPEDEKED